MSDTNETKNNKDPKAINDYYLKISGKAEIPEPATIGHNYSVNISGSITSKTEEDNEDGTSSFYFKFEPILVELLTPLGKTLKAKDTRRKSQMLRSCIWKEWQETQSDQEFKKYYENRMSDIIKKIIDGEL